MTRDRTRGAQRREELAEAATDHVLQHGLVGLSLRPLAAALGTSDRMLLYHFEDKADLVMTVLRRSNERAIDFLASLPPAPDVRSATVALWEASRSDRMLRCQRVYVEAAALGMLQEEPYASSLQVDNQRWLDAVQAHLTRAGAGPERVGRAARLLEAGLGGLLLDLPADDRSPAQEQALLDLADAVSALCGPPTADAEGAERPTSDTVR